VAYFARVLLNVRLYDLKSVFLASQEFRHPTRGAPVVSGEHQIEGGYPPLPGLRAPAAFSVSRIGPTVLRMVLGASLRQYREAAGISTAQAGFKIRATHSKISRMENGRVAVKQRDVEDLLVIYGITDDDERKRLIELALQSAAPGWWHQYADVLPDWFERYIGLERGAAEIRGYQVQFVPGLLQTRDYARSVIRIGNRHASKDEIDRRVRVRMERQRLLTDQEAPKVWVVLDEASLRRAPDGEAEMRAQIEHLLAVTELPRVTLQIVPFRNGPHSAAGGPFSILRFDGWDVPDVVFLEQLDSATYLDDRQVLGYRTIWDQLAVEAAEPDESKEMLRELLRES
jgi:transcriptional regulator with XRE-family HTH domain